METLFVTKNLLKFSLVLILPMRNGNFGAGKRLFTTGKLVLILPMRNGNCVNSASIAMFSGCSYPTYEEWKLLNPPFIYQLVFSVLILPMRNGNQAFYLSLFFQKKLGPYPTYEEWKLCRNY